MIGGKEMVQLISVADIQGGIPLARIPKSTDQSAISYKVFSQSDIEECLTGFPSGNNQPTQIITQAVVLQPLEGDVIFNLITGMAAVIDEVDRPAMLTQNFVRIRLSDKVDAAFLVYLLNRSKKIKNTLLGGLQGSTILKFSVKQLKELELPDLPDIDVQRHIGSVYLKQLRREALKKRVADLETLLIMNKLEEVLQHE